MLLTYLEIESERQEVPLGLLHLQSGADLQVPLSFRAY